MQETLDWSLEWALFQCLCLMKWRLLFVSYRVDVKERNSISLLMADCVILSNLVCKLLKN